MSKLYDLKYELFSYPLYLAHSDHYIFLKKWLGGKKFASNSKVIHTVDSYLDGFDKSYGLKGIKVLEMHLIKCVEVQRNHVKE